MSERLSAERERQIRNFFDRVEPYVATSAARNAALDLFAEIDALHSAIADLEAAAACTPSELVEQTHELRLRARQQQEDMDALAAQIEQVRAQVAADAPKPSRTVDMAGRPVEHLATRTLAGSEAGEDQP